MIKRIAAFAAVLAVAVGSANAGTIDVVQTPNGGGVDTAMDLTGSVTNDVVLGSEVGEPILSQQMLLQLETGAVLESGFGSNLPPSAALIAAFGNHAFDSFVSAGTPDDGFGASPVPLIVAASDKLGGPGGGAVVSPTLWDVLWGPALGQDTTGVSGFLSSRLTLSGDANGTFSYLATFGDQDVEVNGTVENGVISFGPEIPEPASFGLAGLAILGLAGFRRRS